MWNYSASYFRKKILGDPTLRPLQLYKLMDAVGAKSGIHLFWSSWACNRLYTAITGGSFCISNTFLDFSAILQKLYSVCAG